MRVIRKAALFMPEVFGFAVIALVIATGSCRFSRARAQVVIENPCSEEHLRMLYGEYWRFFYALNGCWIGEQPAIASKQHQRRFVIGGAR